MNTFDTQSFADIMFEMSQIDFKHPDSFLLVVNHFMTKLHIKWVDLDTLKDDILQMISSEIKPGAMSPMDYAEHVCEVASENEEFAEYTRYSTIQALFEDKTNCMSFTADQMHDLCLAVMIFPD